MTGFEPRTSGIWSDRFTNWATTTALRGVLGMRIELTFINIIMYKWILHYYDIYLCHLPTYYQYAYGRDDN